MTPATIPATSLTLLLSYLLGAVPFGYLVARARGIDIFEEGSGNIGATNVGRVLGRKFGVLVFFLDFAKGAVPVAVASWLADRLDLSLPPHTLPVLAGLAAFLGHLFPLYLNFRGGKGVATGAGVVAFLLPLPAAAAVGVWLAVVCATRYVSLASLLAVAALVVGRLLTAPSLFGAEAVILNLFCLLAAGLVVERHRGNITRLLHGNENQLKDSPAMQLLTRTVHVLAVGLWFGTTVFFTFVVGLVLFGHFDKLATAPAKEQPSWLAIPPEFTKPPPGDKFPNPLTKDIGSRIGGEAVGPIFPWYYGIQAVCGVLALATALGWYWLPGQTGTLPKVRVVVLLLALVTVGIGGWMEGVVHELREKRNDATDAALRDPEPAKIQAAEEARAAFGRWHFYSLMVNFATLGLVTVGMALVARLPAEAVRTMTPQTPASARSSPSPAAEREEVKEKIS
jgi:acyl-phosphate glycerol 3-phosphate acyltransferase